jgi:hypothetical protein
MPANRGQDFSLQRQEGDVPGRSDATVYVGSKDVLTFGDLVSELGEELCGLQGPVVELDPHGVRLRPVNGVRLSRPLGPLYEARSTTRERLDDPLGGRRRDVTDLVGGLVKRAHDVVLDRLVRPDRVTGRRLARRVNT